MVRVGILGSVGSGKSFVANIFRELGFNIFIKTTRSLIKRSQNFLS
jgi:dephospho-CoA kinase